MSFISLHCHFHFPCTSYIHRYGHFEWWQVVTFCLDTTRIECTSCWRQRRAAGDEVVRSTKGSSNTHRPGRGKCPLIGFPSTSPQHARHSKCKTQPHYMLFNCVILKCRIWYTYIHLIGLQLPCICLFHFHSVQLLLWQHNDKKSYFSCYSRKPWQIPIMVDGPGQLHVSCRSKVPPLPLGGRPLGAFRPCGPWKMVGK